MKTKKDKLIVNQREIELLGKYYEVDNENRIVTMPLHYDKASDLINGKIISKDNYLFDYDELTTINNMIKRVPIMYKINIDIQIDDYEDYEPEKLLSGFNDQMELNQFNYIRENKLKFLKAGMLLIVGIFILFVVGYGKINKWFGSSEIADVYSEIFDIFGWVFIWETVTITFLTPSELSVSSNMFKRRVLNVSFSNNEGVVAQEDLGTKSREWESEKRLERASRWSLLISGIAYLATGSINLVSSVSSLYEILSNLESGISIGSILLIEALGLAIIALEILGGISALCRYMGKRYLKIYSNVFAGITILMAILVLVTSLGSPRMIASSLVTIAISILYLFGYISNIVINRRYKTKE